MLKRLMLLGMLAMTNVWAALPDPLLVLDARNIDSLPKKFRADDVMHSAGSAQFSEQELLKAIKKIHSKKVTIVDLRQESHGYLNGNAISWYGKHDAANTGLTTTEIDNRQKSLLANLAQSKSVTIYNIIKKSPSGSILSAEPEEFNVNNVLSEQELASKYHIGYQRLYVQDFHAPHPKAVDQFLLLVRTLPQDQWLYFHCRGGSGRTTTFMAMYDMLRNAKNQSFEAIIAKQKQLGGKDLTALPDPDVYKYPFALERLHFLKKFYEYAKEDHKERKILWSDWLKQ